MFYLGALIVRVSLISVLTGADRAMESCRAESLGSTHWQAAGMGTPDIENTGYRVHLI